MLAFLAACSSGGKAETSDLPSDSGVAQRSAENDVAASTSGATTYTLSHRDPEALKHATGLKTTGERLDEKRADGKRLVGVKPSALAIARIRKDLAARGRGRAKGGAAQGPSVSLPDATPLGEDLILESAAEPAAEQRAARSRDASVASVMPRQVDNSQLKAFPTIRNQGGLGSCAAFAAGYYQYTHEVGLLHDYDNTNPGDNSTKLSPKWIYNFANEGGDGGSDFWGIYRILAAHGAATWQQFPYAGDRSNPVNYLEWSKEPEVWRDALSRRALDFGVVSAESGSGSRIQAMKELLLNGHVLTYSTQIRGWNYANDGVKDDPTTSADDAWVGQHIATWYDSSAGGPHGMALVGYNDDIWVDIDGDGQVDPEEKGAFKVANSWGEDWMNQGFAWVAYDALNTTSQLANGAASSSRAPILETVYWVTARKNYKPKILAKATLDLESRYDARIQMGVSHVSETSPHTTWMPPAFTITTGQQMGFDGTATRQSATVFFDITEQAINNGDSKYFLRVDNFGEVGPATISNFSVVDALNGEVVTQSLDVPLSVPARVQSQPWSNRAAAVAYHFRDESEAPHLTPAALSVNLGTVDTNAKASTRVTVTNTGTAVTVIHGVSSDNPSFYSDTQMPLRVLPGASAEIEITLQPSVSGSHSGTVSLLSNALEGAAIPIAVSGQGTNDMASAAIGVRLESDADPQDGTIKPIFHIDNRGNQAIRLSDYRLVYYMNVPELDTSAVTWQTLNGNVSARVRPLYMPYRFGGRKANMAVEIDIRDGASLAPSQSASFSGVLKANDSAYRFDEADDWSHFVGPNQAAENVALIDRRSGSIVFGASPKNSPPSFRLSVAPDPVIEGATVRFEIPESIPSSERYVTLDVFQRSTVWDDGTQYLASVGVNERAVNLGGVLPGIYAVRLIRDKQPIAAFEIEKLRRYGDIDGDRRITASDKALVQDHLAGSTSITLRDALRAADVDGDCQVSSLDLAIITKYLAGTIYSIPASSTPCAIPAKVSGVLTESLDGQVSLSWSLATNAERYVVRRSLDGESFETIGETNSPAFVDRNVTNGQEYYYVVIGSHGVADGQRSDVVSATPTSSTVLCSPAVEMVGGQSGSFDTTGPVCKKTQDRIVGWGCSNFDGRSITVNGVAVTCGAQLPPQMGGYYYFDVSAGNYPWASLYWWK